MHMNRVREKKVSNSHQENGEYLKEKFIAKLYLLTHVKRIRFCDINQFESQDRESKRKHVFEKRLLFLPIKYH